MVHYFHEFVSDISKGGKLVRVLNDRLLEVPLCTDVCMVHRCMGRNVERHAHRHLSGHACRQQLLDETIEQTLESNSADMSMGAPGTAVLVERAQRLRGAIAAVKAEQRTPSLLQMLREKHISRCVGLTVFFLRTFA